MLAARNKGMGLSHPMRPERMGPSHLNRSRRGARRPAYLPSICGLFAVVSVSVYAGVLIGMRLPSGSAEEEAAARLRDLKRRELKFESRVKAVR